MYALLEKSWSREGPYWTTWPVEGVWDTTVGRCVVSSWTFRPQGTQVTITGWGSGANGEQWYTRFRDDEGETYWAEGDYDHTYWVTSRGICKAVGGAANAPSVSGLRCSIGMGVTTLMYNTQPCSGTQEKFTVLEACIVQGYGRHLWGRAV